MLRHRIATEPISGMIGIMSFSRLIPDSSIDILTAKHSVSLHKILIKKPIALNIAFAFHGNIHQLKSRSLPKIITRIDKFVDAAVEATFMDALALSQPIKEAGQVKFIMLFQ